MSYDTSIDINNFGDMVSDMADIKQCWSIILMTVKGSDPLRPSFGSGIFDYIDKPLNQFDGSFLAMVIQDLERWEQRCTIQQVKKRIENENIFLYISGTYKATSTPIEISINLTELQTVSGAGTFSLAFNKIQFS